MIVNHHGSKENSAAEIISYFPRDYSTLIVPFFGGGRLSYHVLRRNKSKYVIANDINNDVYSFWMCVKFQPERFMKEVEELLIHSELFKKWAGEKNRVEFVKFISGMSEDDQILWKAIRFYMLNQFGSFCKGTSTIKMESKAPKEVLNNRIQDCLRLIKNIIFGNKDFRKFFRSLSWQGVAKPIIYNDPPYLNTKIVVNNSSFIPEQLKILIEINLALRVKDKPVPFYISENYTPEIMEIIKPYGLNYVIIDNYRIAKKCEEVLISNQPIEKQSYKEGELL